LTYECCSSLGGTKFNIKDLSKKEKFKGLIIHKKFKLKGLGRNFVFRKCTYTKWTRYTLSTFLKNIFLEEKL